MNVDNFIFQVQFISGFLSYEVIFEGQQSEQEKKFSSWVRIFHHFDSVTPLGFHAPFIKVFKAFASN